MHTLPHTALGERRAFGPCWLQGPAGSVGWAGTPFGWLLGPQEAAPRFRVPLGGTRGGSRRPVLANPRR